MHAGAGAHHAANHSSHPSVRAAMVAKISIGSSLYGALAYFAEMKAYQPIPTIADFINEDGCDNLKETIEANYRKVKREILSLVDSEIQRIKNTPVLSHLIPNK